MRSICTTDCGVNPRVRAFTIIEAMVALVIVTILIGIGLAIGAKVRESSEVELTRTELAVLSSELIRLEHRTGVLPANMAEFLQEDQQMYLQPGLKGGWFVRPCAISQLPPSLLVRGTMTGPDGSTIVYVAAIKDAFGMPIHFVSSPQQSPRAPFFFSAGPDKTLYTPDDIYSYSP